MNRSELWLYRRPAAALARMRLFCLPHAGGGAMTFRPWGSGVLPALPSDIELCSILLPGRETRSSATPFTHIDPLVDAMSAELKPWLDLPYAVFGHSMGALLAYEWTRRLAKDGSPLPAHLFLSGRRAPSPGVDPYMLHTLSDGAFIEALNRIYRGLPQELLDNPELMEVFLPILRADIAVVESYSYEPAEPLDCPITVFAGASDTSTTWEQLIAWKRLTRRNFAIHLFPGGHFYPREPLLTAIAAELKSPK